MHASQRSCRTVLALACLLSPFTTGLAAPDTHAPAAKEAVPLDKAHPTALPRSFTFQYQVQLGGVRGSGELSWTRARDTYEARLKGTVAGVAVVDWASSGGFDATGVAPSRYVEHRLAKSDRDVRFRKGESRISFSGSHSSDIPYVAGVQDRVSWLVQLPAIVAADPAKARTGTRIALYVVGTRGRTGNWIFESAGRDNIHTPAGTVRAVKWTCNTGKGAESQVEVWLDPERHYLPARIRLTLTPPGVPLEMTLAEASP